MFVYLYLAHSYYGCGNIIIFGHFLNPTHTHKPPPFFLSSLGTSTRGKVRCLVLINIECSLVIMHSDGIIFSYLSYCLLCQKAMLNLSKLLFLCMGFLFHRLTIGYLASNSIEEKKKKPTFFLKDDLVSKSSKQPVSLRDYFNIR